MPAGFITSNLFDEAFWILNDPVQVELLVKEDGDSRPSKFYGLVHKVEKERLTIMYQKSNLERDLDYIMIDDVNNGGISVTNLKN